MDKASANLKIIHGDGGEVTVFDVEFLRGAKASHTLSAQTTGGVWVYVEIAFDDYSKFVAMSLIHGPDATDAPEYVEVPDDGDEPLYESLAALAARVIKLDAEGAIPKRFVMRDGQPISMGTITPLTGLPIPRIVRWRPTVNGTEYLLSSVVHLADDRDPGVEFDRNDEGIRAAIICGHDLRIILGPRSSTFRKALSNLLGSVVGVCPGPDGDIAKDRPDVEKTAASLNEFADERGFKDCDQLLEDRTGRFTLRIREDAQSGDRRWDLDSSGSLFD